MSDSGNQVNPDADASVISGLRDEMALERARQRRLMGWFVTCFAFIILVAVALLLMAGVTVLRQAGQVIDTVDEMRSYVAVNSARIAAMTNRFAELERVQLGFASRLSALQTSQAQSLEQLSNDIQRQIRWAEVKEDADERDKRNLNDRLLKIGEDIAQTTAGLDRVRRRLDKFVTADGIVVVPAGPATETSETNSALSATQPRDRADMILDSFASASIDEMFEELQEEVVKPVRDQSIPTTISVVSFPNGDRYEGEFRNGLMHGWGVYTSTLGDRYEGRFENDIRNGPGILTTTSGERYTGPFVNGIREGLGSLTQSDGSRYVGDFRNDMINGRGVMFYPDGSKYAGDFMNGRKHGQGVIRFPNGDVYEGEFRSDLRTGKGEYRFADGSRYSGDFVDGVRHGQGHYRAADGAEYIGGFKNGKMNGEGVRVYPDGQRVKGIWHDGKHVRDIRE
jgi:hypothetical protein